MTTFASTYLLLCVLATHYVSESTEFVQTTPNYTACGGGQNTTLFASTTAQFIYSPNYPNLYPINIRCRWTIVTNRMDMVIRLHVYDMDLERSDNCRYDYLSINYPPNELQSKLCYTSSSQCVDYDSSGSSMTITFKSDESNTRSGFKLSYQTFQKSLLPAACRAGGHATLYANSTTQYVKSPSYPCTFNIGGNVCDWNIVAPFNMIVYLKVVSEDSVDSSSSCLDQLVVQDAGRNGAQTQLCYNGDMYYSASSSVHLISSNTGMGGSVSIGSNRFMVSFRAVTSSTTTTTTESLPVACGSGQILWATADEQYIESPNYPNIYPNNLDCTWTIKTSDNIDATLSGNMVVHVHILVLSLEIESSCRYDYLSIYDVHDGSPTTLLAQMCTPPSPQWVDFYSTGSSLQLVFHTDSSRAGQGFRLYYEATHENVLDNNDLWCQRAAFEVPASMGTWTDLKSPDYPNDYPSNAYCGVTIDAGEGQIVKLQIPDNFKVEYSYDCLALYNDHFSDLIVNCCSDGCAGSVYYSRGRYMTVRFTSDSSNQYSGFQLSFTAASPDEYRTVPSPTTSTTTTTTTTFGPPFYNAGSGSGSTLSTGLITTIVVIVTIAILVLTVVLRLYSTNRRRQPTADRRGLIWNTHTHNLRNQQTGTTTNQAPNSRSHAPNSRNHASRTSRSHAQIRGHAQQTRLFLIQSSPALLDAPPPYSSLVPEGHRYLLHTVPSSPGNLSSGRQPAGECYSNPAFEPPYPEPPPAYEDIHPPPQPQPQTGETSA